MNPSSRTVLRKRASLIVALSTCTVLLPAIQLEATGKDVNPSRPMDIACDTTFAFTPTGSVRIEGQCQYTHLGNTHAVAEQIVISQPDGTLTITNTSVYTAANGDELFATAVGTGRFTSPTTVVFSGVETYSGGTGRFSDATGSAPFAGSAEFTSASAGVGQFRGTGGVISY